MSTANVAHDHGTSRTQPREDGAATSVAAPHRRADDLRPHLDDLPRGRRVDVASVSLEICTLRQAVDLVWCLLGDQQVHLVATANVDQTLHVLDDPEVRQAFSAATLRFCDGAPLLALTRLLGVPMPGRVTGADLLPVLCARASRQGVRVGLVGGAPGVPEEAARRLGEAYPGLEVVATLSPPLGFVDSPEQTAEVVAALRDARPDLVFVCLGCPQQELWVHRNRDLLPSAVYLGVGGAVDFAAGRTRRAPDSWQRYGFEWLHRLLHDWNRLWRRYLLRDVRFVPVAARALWATLVVRRPVVVSPSAVAADVKRRSA